MAIFHLSARAPITRASGRSATAAAAYRAGTLISDQRTGQVFDYRRRKGVLDARIHLPGGRLVQDREKFWNGIEIHHRRRDAVLAREVVLALPGELDPDERAALAFSFSKKIAKEFGVGVDCALHMPSRDGDCVFRLIVTTDFGIVTSHFGHRDRYAISADRDRPFRHRDRPFR